MNLVTVVHYVLFIQLLSISANANRFKREAEQATSPPSPLQTASYVSPDGLTLVVVFDRPVNLSASIETVEQRKAFANTDEQRPPIRVQLEQVASESSKLTASSDSLKVADQSSCQDLKAIEVQNYETQHLVGGIQICARLLTKKTLRFLHKYRLYNCLWPSRVQFLIQLGKPAPNGSVKIAFQRNVISEFGQFEGQQNGVETSIDLNRLPLESLGIPMTPRLALTGPNQVPPCGHFALSAHLWSPHGTSSGESVNIVWSVERIGFSTAAPQFNGSFAGSSPVPARTNQQQQSTSESTQTTELKWKTLQQVVSNNKANNLVLDAQLLQFVPQIYEFHVTVTYATSLASITLNATHQVGRIEFETPVGTIYGTHILAQQQSMNPNHELLLLADVQVPDCATSVKQVGLYWQVSDPRVRFEQTYSPFYIARTNTLPEQAMLEFRMNLFYGIRVKKFASAGTFVSTGDSTQDSSISNGTLVLTIGHDSDRQLELFGHGSRLDADRFTYSWSCFDGKTAQPCFRSSKSLGFNSTRYEITTLSRRDPNQLPDSQRSPIAQSGNGLQLLDRHNQKQPVLRLPLNWMEPESQLWFGLQRFDRQSTSHHAKTEYTLVSLQPGDSPALAMGPVLIGAGRHQATVRNPLTGAVILVAGVPTVIVGRLTPRSAIQSFVWHVQNLVQPLHWIVRNETNPITGEEELVTELYLNKNLLVPFAHYQIQLIACTNSGIKTSASLSLDIVQSVSQCRVEANQDAISGSLVVSINQCNIPLGLSPITYQIYLADTTEMDGFMENNRRQMQNQQQPEEEYINEIDESILESQSHPLTTPQLTPVFTMNSQTVASLLGPFMQSESGGNSSKDTIGARFRFGARVCSRLQECRMFYSVSLGPKNLIQIAATSSNLSLPLMQLATRDSKSNQTFAIQTMLDSSKRANLAGNSIAAISLLNGALNMAQKLMSSANTHLKLEDKRQDDANEERLRDLMQVAIHDTLQFGASSIQRQFHYTDSGQTNLVTSALARVLNLPQSSVEYKFKAMRLLNLLTRRSIQEYLNLKMNCLADFKTLQSAYESLLSTFSHYSLESSTKHDKHQSNAGSNNRYPWLMTGLSATIANSSSSATPSASTKASRKRREDAILAYLRTIRQTYRSFLSATSIQLSLGDTQQFEFDGRNVDTPLQPLAKQQLTPSSSNIVSYLSHLNDLTNTIQIDLQEFGLVTLKIGDNLISKLKSRAENAKLRCRNDSITTCSTFIVAVSVFAGKSPFRSLDETPTLQVPVLEVALLSSIDGSDILGLMRESGDPLDSDDSGTLLTFVVPNSEVEEDIKTDSNDKVPVGPKRYKCYSFDERANEWLHSGQTDGEEEDKTAGERKIKCRFNSLGVFGAFQRESVSVNSSTEIFVLIGIVAIVVLIVLVSVLGCMASSSKSRKSRESGEDENETQRHPEETYRNDFDYPPR